MDVARGAVWLVGVTLLAGCIAGPPVAEDTPYRPYLNSFAAAVHWPGTEVEVRVFYLEDQALLPKAEEALHEQLPHALGKGIQVTKIRLDWDSDPQRVWALSELGALDREWSQLPTEPGRVAINLALLDGCVNYSAERPCIAGVAMHQTGFVMVDKRGIVTVMGQSLTGLLPRDVGLDQEDVQRYLVIHELGHVIGLVGHRIPMEENRIYDDQCRCHSDRPESVMHGGGSSSILVESVMQGRIDLRNYRFDSEDIRDFRAFQDLGRQAVEDGAWDPSRF